MAVVPTVASADEGGDDDWRIEVDTGVKKIAVNAMKMRRRESWGCIIGEASLYGPGKKGWNLFLYSWV